MSKTVLSLAVSLLSAAVVALVFSIIFISQADQNRKWFELSEKISRLERQIELLKRASDDGRRKTEGASEGTPEKISAEDDTLSEQERQMIEALNNDPEFKKVHDHLTRQHPIELNILPPAAPGSAEPAKPMSERPPVQFSLPK